MTKVNPPLKFHARTDRGRVRLQNEDAFYASAEEGLFIVADGMGGQAAGAVAAEITVEVLPLLLRQRLAGSRTSRTATQQALQDALAELSHELRRRSEGQSGLQGMGAAVVVAWIRGDQLWLGHMGDCRAYLCRGRSLERLTKDHTVVQLLVDSGELKPEEAATHPARSRLTRFVGMSGEPLPDTRVAELQPGDKLLLCSDGLTGMVDDTKLLTLMKPRLSPRTMCERLVGGANEAGGKDNITGIVISWPRPSLNGISLGSQTSGTRRNDRLDRN